MRNRARWERGGRNGSGRGEIQGGRRGLEVEREEISNQIICKTTPHHS